MFWLISGEANGFEAVSFGFWRLPILQVWSPGHKHSVWMQIPKHVEKRPEPEYTYLSFDLVLWLGFMGLIGFKAFSICRAAVDGCFRGFVFRPLLCTSPLSESFRLAGGTVIYLVPSSPEGNQRWSESCRAGPLKLSCQLTGFDSGP